MTESEIKIWNEAIKAAMVASMMPNGLGRIAELIKCVQKSAPESRDLSEEDFAELEEWAKSYGLIPGRNRISYLIAEIRRRRKVERQKATADATVSDEISPPLFIRKDGTIIYGSDVDFEIIAPGVYLEIEEPK